MTDSDGSAQRSAVRRTAWVALGLALTALGGIGIVVPGLPSTVFFVGAAACFSRSSPRFERWLLSLPLVGRMVDDYRQGRGMPLESKAVAVLMIAGFTSLAVFVIDNLWAAGSIAALGLVGIAVVTFWVPGPPPSGSTSD